MQPPRRITLVSGFCNLAKDRLPPIHANMFQNLRSDSGTDLCGHGRKISIGQFGKSSPKTINQMLFIAPLIGLGNGPPCGLESGSLFSQCSLIFVGCKMTHKLPI